MGDSKIPHMYNGSENTGANTVEFHGRGSHWIDGGWSGTPGMNISYFRPNESMADNGIRTPHVVRGIRTLRARGPATAKAWTLQNDASATNSKKSPLQTSAFFINHPILAVVTLLLITLIGFVCVFELPIRRLPF
jgi:hypothetical protein